MSSYCYQRYKWTRTLLALFGRTRDARAHLQLLRQPCCARLGWGWVRGGRVIAPKYPHFIQVTESNTDS